MTHKDLVARAARWLRGTKRCSVIITLKTICTDEQPDAIGWNSLAISILAECKASRADFLRDAKKIHRLRPAIGMGNYRYYFAPPNVIAVDELPEGWGLMVCHPSGALSQASPALHQPANNTAELRLLLAHTRRNGIGEAWWADVDHDYAI